jgi:glutathione synthase/RimK-type ligase-like ATP-grasp enzyme
MGIVVYPSVATCWHYDDKVAQKYLLEAIGAPVIPTFISFNIADAKQWAKNAEYPPGLQAESQRGLK